MIDFRAPIEMEGVRVNSGDIVFGDVDGVLVVPREAEEEIFMGAIEKGARRKAGAAGD